jgi:hypothetical protein
VINQILFKFGRVTFLTALAALLWTGCRSQETGQVTPIYNKDTGRLEQLVGSRQGDGHIDVRAQMDGAHVRSVEIDRNHDGHPDRWEYYETNATTHRSLLARAEEANGSDAQVTRREFYNNGVIERVEEDTDNDSRIDKWETYEHGSLARMDLDLAGRGFPDRRLIYRPDGTFDRSESDPTGDGRFKGPAADPNAARPGRQ